VKIGKREGGRDVARHELRGLNPQKQKYSPPNEMNPLALLGLGLCFFAFSIIYNYEQLKEPAAGYFFSLQIFLAQTSP